MPDKERSRITHDRSSPKTANKRSSEKANKSDGSWIRRSGGEIVKRPANLGGETGNGGSGDPPKKGE